MSQLSDSYDRVADEYAKDYFEELSRKPFDCELLDNFSRKVFGRGQVWEIGCGPGQVARYLKDRGVDVCGVDLSGEMVKCANRLNPDISFTRGSMLGLESGDDTFAGLVSFYAIIHLRRQEMLHALKEFYRVLKPGGLLLLAFHGGEGELHRDEWYGKPVAIDVTLMSAGEMLRNLKDAGFTEVRIAEREPYEFEYPTRRMYASAIKACSQRHSRQESFP